MFMPFWDPTMLLLIPAMILAFYAQTKVKSTYEKYSEILAASRRTGRDIARTILSQNGITDVEVVEGEGFLSDHYDPIKKVVRLSPHRPGLKASEASWFTGACPLNSAEPLLLIGRKKGWLSPCG